MARHLPPKAEHGSLRIVGFGTFRITTGGSRLFANPIRDAPYESCLPNEPSAIKTFCHYTN